MKIFHKIFELTAPFTIGVSAALVVKGHYILSLFFLYLFPLCLHRLMCSLYPIERGGSYIEKGHYHPWLTSYRIQKLFLYIPLLERILMLIPGLFSLWLRSWGSQIGKGVAFPPEIVITDRSFLKIGDNVIIGNQCTLSPHLIKIKNAKAFVFVDNITIEGHCFIGGKSSLFAGAHLTQAKALPAVSYMSVKMKDRFYELERQTKKVGTLSL